MSVIITSTVIVTRTDYRKDHLELSQIIGPNKMGMTNSAGFWRVSKKRYASLAITMDNYSLDTVETRTLVHWGQRDTEAPSIILCVLCVLSFIV